MRRPNGTVPVNGSELCYGVYRSRRGDLPSTQSTEPHRQNGLRSGWHALRNQWCGKAANHTDPGGTP